MPPLLKSLRLRQWTKNLVVFAGLAFSGRASDVEAVELTLHILISFCLVSSAVYLVNDLIDRDRDRRHPSKRLRPIAAGTLSTRTALIAAFVLVTVGVAVGWTTGVAVNAVLAYLALQAAYSIWLKNVVVLDVFAIAAGFTLRVLAGVWAIDAPMSPWLIACTMQLALFLALCKRRAEAESLGDTDDLQQRPILAEYQRGAADVMVAVVAASTLVTYTLYTLLPVTVLGATAVHPTSQAGAPGMVYTLPFVFYGMLRYLYLVYRHDHGERPEWIATTDLPILLTVLAYGAVVARIIYG